MSVNGATVTAPCEAPLAKNSTLVTVPPLTEASAPRLTFAGAAKTAPLAGLVMVTDGGETGELTVMLKGAARTDPADMPLVKNCTFATVPLLTAASTLMVTFAGATKTAPLTGLVMLMVGVGGVTGGVERVYEKLLSPVMNAPPQ